MKSKPLSIFLWFLAGLWLMMLISGFEFQAGPNPSRITYSEFLADIADGAVAEVTIQDQEIQGTRTDGSYFETFTPGDPGLMKDLLDANVTVRAIPPERPGILAQILASWLPFLLLMGVWFWFVRRGMNGGAGGGGSLQLRQEPRPPARRGRGQGHLRRCRRCGGGQGRGWRTGGFPARPGQIPETGRQDPPGRAHGGPPGYR
jgi:cell division protease FtsH